MENLKLTENRIQAMAKEAFDNLMKNYWSDEKNYFVDPYKEFGRDTLSDILWAYTQLMLSLETYGLTAKEKLVFDRIDKEINAFYNNHDDEWLLYTGGNNNPAMDDAAWSSMAFMMHYRYTGNEKSLEMSHQMIKRAYAHWVDVKGMEYGIWYRFNENNPEGNDTHFKSLYSGGLMLSELEYYKLTKGTDKEDKELHELTKTLYNWAVENLHRVGTKVWNGKEYTVNDRLYFCDLYEWTDTGRINPVNIDNFMGSGTCALFANTSMAVIHKRFWEETGDKMYLDRAVDLANAICESEYFNKNGVLWNDRDAWTDCAFMGFFAREVLPLPGVKEEMPRLLMTTASSIMHKEYFEGGFYGSDWEGGDRWVRAKVFGSPYVMDNCATSAHILFATYEALKNGSLKLKDGDEKLFADSYPIQKAPDYIDLKAKKTLGF